MSHVECGMTIISQNFAGIVGVFLSFSFVESCLLESPERCCSPNVTSVGVQKRRDLYPLLKSHFTFCSGLFTNRCHPS